MRSALVLLNFIQNGKASDLYLKTELPNTSKKTETWHGINGIKRRNEIENIQIFLGNADTSCTLLVKEQSCVCRRRESASRKVSLRSVSKTPRFPERVGLQGIPLAHSFRICQRKLPLPSSAMFALLFATTRPSVLKRTSNKMGNIMTMKIGSSQPFFICFYAVSAKLSLFLCGSGRELSFNVS